MHSARSALPVIAAFLRARQREPLAQEIEQRGARINLNLQGTTIDRGSNLHDVSRPARERCRLRAIRPTAASQ